jgi:RimJ/RimL family protein N-acetyltransferase
MIGDLGLHFVGGDQAEIGYTLSPQHQGHGYAFEAVTAALEYLFTTLEKHRVIARVDPENRRSVRLLERIGMRREAHHISAYPTEDGWSDECVYAMLRQEWLGTGDEERHEG